MGTLNGSLMVQPDGFPQGSPISPGVENLFASWKEATHWRSLTPPQRSSLMARMLRTRWIDDVLTLYVSGTNLLGFESPKFYGGRCIIEPAQGSSWAGFRMLLTPEAVYTMTSSPNIESVLANDRIAKVSCTHGLSSLPDGQKRGLITGGLSRILDYTYGPDTLVLDQVHAQLRVYELMGFPTALIDAAAVSLSHKWGLQVAPRGDRQAARYLAAVRMIFRSVQSASHRACYLLRRCLHRDS